MHKSSLTFLLGCAITLTLCAQTSTPPVSAPQQMLTVKSPYTSADAYIQNEWSTLGLMSSDDLTLTRTHKWDASIKKERLEQSHLGIPVIGATWTLHYRDGVIHRATGKLYDVTSVQMTPQVNDEEAKKRAKFFLENHFKEDVDIPRPLRLHGHVESTRLVLIDKGFPEPVGQMRLAYECITHLNTVVHVRERVYVDAMDGDIITSLSLVSHTSVEGVANTYYYGEKSIITDSVSANEFILWDEGRGVYTGDLSTNSDFFSDDAADFLDEDNYWDNRNSYRDEVAGDAHYCSSSMHDFMLSRYDWKGPDGNNMEYRAYVHAAGGAPFVNAYWTGFASYYGDGDCRGYGPLTTLEVVGHEFAHGFTQFSSGLIYNSESGGMNEATSDMFGKALEKAYHPEGFDWLIGESFIENDELESFRSMEDPNARGNPKYYGGLFWENNGVHSWSGLWNYWFYLLSEGGSGVTEEGYSFEVDSIGIDAALDIVFLLHTGYLTPNATYYECRNLSELAVEDLHGPGSAIWAAVEEAWKAIGVTSAGGNPGLERDLAVQVDFTSFGLCRPDSAVVAARIFNAGSETILMGDSILLEYDADDYRQREWMILEENLEIRRVAEFTFSEKTPVNSNQLNVTVTIISSDANPDNDFAFWFQNYTESEFNENILMRTNLTANAEKLCDEISSGTLGFQFYNSGCSDIPRGTILNVTSNSDDGSLSETYTFFLIGGLASGQSTFFQQFIDGIDLSSGEYSISSTLNYPDDMEADNNDLASIIPKMALTPGNLIDFNLGSIFLNDQFAYEQGFASSAELVRYRGERMYMITGSNVGQELSCKSLADQLKDINTRSSISFCVDATETDNPELHFDLLMKSEDYLPAAGQDPDITCLLEVRLPKEYGVEYDIFTSSDDEELVHYSLPLPDDFSDQITLLHFVARGDLIDRDNPNIDIGDVILLDNIEIREGTVSTYEPSASTIQVFPNPSGDVVNFRTQGDGEYELEVYSAAGVSAHEAVFTDTHQWLLYNQSAGVYFYRLTNRISGNEVVGKVVVQ